MYPIRGDGLCARFPRPSPASLPNSRRTSSASGRAAVRWFRRTSVLRARAPLPTSPGRRSSFLGSRFSCATSSAWSSRLIRRRWTNCAKRSDRSPSSRSGVSGSRFRAAGTGYSWTRPKACPKRMRSSFTSILTCACCGTASLYPTLKRPRDKWTSSRCRRSTIERQRRGRPAPVRDQDAGAPRDRVRPLLQVAS